MSRTFAELGVPEEIVRGLHARGIDEAFPIQIATLPDALSGHDVCGRAPTGSGKTLAFGIPLVVRVGHAKPRRPKALVLAPTRELAAQIRDELALLGAARDCRIASFYGGVGFGPQLDALRRGVDIAVACPGRLSDLIDRGALRLSEVEIVVVDEADRMADMGFMPVVRELLDQVNENRQTMLYSATLDGDVKELIHRYQDNPKRFEIEGPADSIGESAMHYFWRTDANGRAALATRIVKVHQAAMVFCRTKRGVDRLVKHFAASGLDVGAIHGDRSQAQRDRALEAFKTRRLQVLVGTDVAARGIHVDGVDCVVHFDPPEDEKAYVHRSGRTGRAGAGGTVVSLVTREHQSFVRRLQSRLDIGSSIEDPDEAILNAEPIFVKNVTRERGFDRDANRSREGRPPRARGSRPYRPQSGRPVASRTGERRRYPESERGYGGRARSDARDAEPRGRTGGDSGRSWPRSEEFTSASSGDAPAGRDRQRRAPKYRTDSASRVRSEPSSPRASVGVQREATTGSPRSSAPKRKTASPAFSSRRSRDDGSASSSWGSAPRGARRRPR